MKQALIRGAERFLEWVLPIVLLVSICSWAVVDYIETRNKVNVMWNYLNTQAQKPATSPTK